MRMNDFKFERIFLRSYLFFVFLHAAVRAFFAVFIPFALGTSLHLLV